jgi:ankyrin repeat protein
MSLPPPSPPQDDDPIIAQFKPRGLQWELTDDNINRIDPRTGYTILHNYCFYINTTPLEVYRYLIEVKGCDVNARDNNNDTPLHCALRYFNPNKGGEITVLNYLLSQNGIDGDTKGERGYTILHDICSKINKFRLDAFKLLIETMGCDVNAQNDDGSTPLHKALECFNPRHGGDIAVLKYLLSQKGVNGNIKDKYGYTLLHTACDNMNKLPIDVFKILIETLGCDINVQDNCKQTPLHNALGGFEPNYGDITVLTYLLSQKGINVNIKGWNGETLLHIACKKARRLPLEIF